MRSLRIKQALVIVVLAWLLSGCSGNNTAQTEGPSSQTAASPGQETVTLKIGESVQVPALNATIAFDTVLEDSRCPVDVECLWQGNARVGLRLQSDQLDESFELNTTRQGGETEHTAGDYRIAIDRLEPKPQSTNGIDPKLYVLRLKLLKQ